MLSDEEVLNFNYWRFGKPKLSKVEKNEVLEIINRIKLSLDNEMKRRFQKSIYDMTDTEIKKEHWSLQEQAYRTGILVSKKYTSKEIDEKKEYYLTLPYDYVKYRKGKKFWIAMVDKHFNSRDFSDYPDKHFLLLDTIFTNGTL